MRYSNTSVEQFHLGRLVTGIAEGRIGIPEFQRDFDWNESDIRSLLATVFAGWPAGSLLLLEGDSPLFRLRAMEGAPSLADVSYAVLDGQQRLTSLYQALYGRGETIFAVRWDMPDDQDIEECIVSVRRSAWDKSYASLAQNIDARIIPMSSLKSPTEFFSWRDSLLDEMEDRERRAALRDIITNVYTYRLSAIHDYEFPVVKIDKNIEPSAIARIFEKVNKTGLTLNSFDLMVAKSFDAGWNLRDKWIDAKEAYPELGEFFGDDGLPLLQAISLIRRNDLRQASVLSLSKQNVQSDWDMVARSASTVVKFLRDSCGVVRRDFMPYLNMLPPFIALETKEFLTDEAAIFSGWFWSAGFLSLYDVAANTRLVSHYKKILDGDYTTFERDDLRVIDPSSSTRKAQKALWSVATCAYVVKMISDADRALGAEFSAELEVSSLYSRSEVQDYTFFADDQAVDSEFRSALNSFLVPRRLASVTKKVGSHESVEVCRHSEFGDYAITQLPVPNVSNLNWGEFRHERTNWLLDFMKSKGVSGGSIMVASPDGLTSQSVEF